jgi:hypothetical protein
MKIRTSDLETAEVLLDGLRDQSLGLSQIAQLVGPLGPISEHLRSVASARARRSVASIYDAVMLLGVATVETEVFSLIASWLEALESAARNPPARVLPMDARGLSATMTPPNARRYARGA